MAAPAVKIEMTNQRDYERNIRQLARMTGRSVKRVIERQTAITAGQLARRYPPSKKGVGKQAIANDLSRVVVPLSERPVLRHLAERFPGDERFDITAAKLERWHMEKRNKRTGRIEQTINSKKGWYNADNQIPERLHVTEAAFKRYVNARAKSVGQLKAGWLWAVDRFPGAAKPSAWVRKHSNHGRGVDRMRADGSGFIEITNPYQHASRWKRVNDFVMSSRRKSVVKEVRAALRAEIRKYQERGAAA